MTPEILFWLAAVLTLYAYLGYPVLLYAFGKVVRRTVAPTSAEYAPGVTIIIPVHNEERVIDAKLKNLDGLRYPRDRLQVLIVSDGSTDQTQQRVSAYGGDLKIRFLAQERRQGKAAALNLGLQNTASEIVIFSDASIMLDADAVHHIVQPFQDATVGCVSGEDLIPGGGGEGLYGRYELFLRNLESRVSSIAGASGSFYAMRTRLCKPFLSGMAPDFLSVLVTVENGYRAITEACAYGTMTSTKSSRGEFTRKVRTLIRGMTALWHMRQLLNPFRYGLFSMVLWSHKLMRWLVPFFMILAFIANLSLLGQAVYLSTFILQIVFYSLAALGMTALPMPRQSAMVKIPVYFTVVNAAIFIAWLRFLAGARLEVWEPTRR